MPKHSNNRPWPDNLRYDFNLPPTISSSDAEAFISSPRPLRETAPSCDYGTERVKHMQRLPLRME